MDHTQQSWRLAAVDLAPGIIIRRLRKAKGFSQREVGDAIGEGGMRVSRYERGKLPVPTNTLCSIAAMLGVEPSVFGVGPEAVGAAPLMTQSAEERDLLAAFRRIPTDEGRDSAFQIVNAIGAMQEHASC